MFNCQQEILDPTDLNISDVNVNFTDIDPSLLNGLVIERPLYIVSSPENSITRTISIDTNILDLYLSSNHNLSRFSIAHLDGVDVAIIDTNALNINLEDKTISGDITLNRRLDFENPIDGGENAGDNDYEIAIFRVISTNSSNDFKLIVRITNLEPEPQKLEILIDSFHLDGTDQKRGIKEIYLYEDKEVMDPLMGNDPNDFLVPSLIESTNLIGNVDASTDIAKLYDKEDSIDAFLTATTVNSNSNTYHRLTFNFTEEINLKKVAIRGRQVGGYYGFFFIIRDENNRIIYTHQASNPLSRGSGSDENATSTYSFVPDYAHFDPIDDYRIHLNNIYFDISENTTNVISIDNFFVTSGYEYERGFVSINPGADIDKFNVGDLYFLDNELVGLSFKTAPDAEDEQDADGDNTYEVGTLTISNYDGGSLTFSLPVRVVNVPSTVSLSSDSVHYTVSTYMPNVIEDLTKAVLVSNFENDISLGQGTYRYGLAGNDSGHFKVVGNTLKTANDVGFTNNNDEYNLQVIYYPEGTTSSATLNVTVSMVQWHKRNILISRRGHQAVGLNDNSIVRMGGNHHYYGDYNNIFFSRDGGYSWSPSGSGVIANWLKRSHFQAVVLSNDDILVMGGRSGSDRLNDIHRSSDGGITWSHISLTNGWRARSSFQAVVLNNSDILIMGGYSGTTYLNDIWRSSDGGTNWSQIPVTGHWGARAGFQTVVLNNNDILVMGGGDNQIWSSRDGGTNWSQIPVTGHWAPRQHFQATVLHNGSVLVMGGSGLDSFTLNDMWISSDNGRNWNNITPLNYQGSYQFQTVTLPGDDRSFVVIIGGYQKVRYSTSGFTDGIHEVIWFGYFGKHP